MSSYSNVDGLHVLRTVLLLYDDGVFVVDMGM